MVRMCSVHDESDEDGRDDININGQMVIKDILLREPFWFLPCLPVTKCTEPCLGPSSDLVTPVAMPALPTFSNQLYMFVMPARSPRLA